MGERDICKDPPSEANTPGCAGGQGQILHFTVVGGHNRQKIFSRAIPVGGHQRCHCTVLYIFPLKYFYSLCRFGALKNDPMSVILFSILACSHRLWPGITHHCVVQHARRQVASNRWSLAKHDIPSCIAPGSRSERIFIDINVKVHLSFASLCCFSSRRCFYVQIYFDPVMPQPAGIELVLCPTAMTSLKVLRKWPGWCPKASSR